MREETRLVRQFIRDAAQKGVEVTYEQIETHVGWPSGSSQSRHRSVLYGAFRWLEKEHGFYAVNTPKVGYRFTRGGAALDASEMQRTQKIRSQVDKMLVTYEHCKADASPEERLYQKNKISFLEFAVSDRTQQAIEQATAKSKKTIDWSEKHEAATKKLFELYGDSF